MPVTKVDERGRILLPKEVRDKMKIKLGEGLLIDIGENAGVYA